MSTARRVKPATWKQCEKAVRVWLKGNAFFPYAEFTPDKLPPGIQQNRKFSLYQYVLEQVGDPGTADHCMNSPEQIAALTSYKRALGTYLAVHDGLEQLIKPEGDAVAKQERAFINAYALFSGACAGLQSLEADLLDRDNDYLNVDFSLEKDELMDNLTHIVLRGLARQHVKLGTIDDENLRKVLQGAYSFLINQVRWEKDRFSDVVQRYNLGNASWVLEGEPWGVSDVVITGFEFRPGFSQATVVERVEWDQIIGNTDLKESLISIADNFLGWYDKGGNPALDVVRLPNTYLLKGRPGTGKTLTIQGMVSHLSRMSEERSLPFETLFIDSRIKSKWFGEGEDLIRKEFAKVHSGDKVYLIVVEDIDALLASREDMREDSPERGLMQELLNQLEGVASSTLGNYLLIATTNKPLTLDDALSSRLRQNEMFVTGPETPEDFGKLLQLELKRGSKHGYVRLSKKSAEIPEKKWTDLGALCFHPDFPDDYAHSLSGRDVRNLCRRLELEAAKGLKIPAEARSELDELRRTDIPAFQTKYATFLTQVYTDAIESGIRSYHETRDKDVVAADEAEFQRHVKQYRLAAMARGDPSVVAAEYSFETMPMEMLDKLMTELEKAKKQRKQ